MAFLGAAPFFTAWLFLIRLEFTCEMACRTSSVLICDAGLSNPGGNGSDFNGRSDLIFRIEDIRPRFATVVISNVDLMRSYEYSASPLIIVNDVVIGAGIVRGEIPACKKQTNTLISYSKLHCTKRQ